MEFLGIIVVIASLVLGRLAFEYAASWLRRRDPFAELYGLVCGIRIEIGTGGVSAEECCITDIKREQTLSNQIKTTIIARSRGRNF